MMPGVIEQVMAEQYPALRTDGRNRRERYRRRVPRVADSREEMRTDSRSEYHPKNDYKGKKHEPKPKEEKKEELYRFPVVDFTV